MSLLHGFVKRCVAMLALRVNIGSMRNKDFNLFKTSSYGSNINRIIARDSGA